MFEGAGHRLLLGGVDIATSAVIGGGGVADVRQLQRGHLRVAHLGDRPVGVAHDAISTPRAWKNKPKKIIAAKRERRPPLRFRVFFLAM